MGVGAGVATGTGTALTAVTPVPLIRSRPPLTASSRPSSVVTCTGASCGSRSRAYRFASAPRLATFRAMLRAVSSAWLCAWPVRLARSDSSTATPAATSATATTAVAPSDILARTVPTGRGRLTTRPAGTRRRAPSG